MLEGLSDNVPIAPSKIEPNKTRLINCLPVETWKSHERSHINLEFEARSRQAVTALERSAQNTMKLLPPSPKDSDTAALYVKEIPRRKGQSDYRAIRSAGINPLMVAPMFFVFMANSADDFTVVSSLLALAFGAFGIFCILLGYRTLELLELFPDRNLPAPREDSRGAESAFPYQPKAEQGEDAKPDNAPS